MARKQKSTVLGTVVTVIVIGIVVWMRIQEDHATPLSDTELLSEVQLSSDKFEVLNDCTLIDNSRNDGDSFHVQTPEGKEEVRLYFVDAPESEAREYGNNENNHQRIADQGKALGGLNRDQTTQMGLEAKHFVKKLLTGKKFTIVTTRERVYRSRRIYAYVIVPYQGQDRYLHELLVLHGLGRIRTKPMIMPDNTSGDNQRDRLRQIEQHAQSEKNGAWAIQ